MIGKIVMGKDFYGVLSYNQKKVREGVGYVIDSNIERSTSVEMTKEFNLIRELRPSLRKAVLHVSLNLPHSDYLDDKKFASFGCDYLMKMGFDNNQFIMYRHTDTEHEHIHIIANRVRYSGRVTSDSNIKRRSRKILDELEQKYGLTQIVGKTNSKRSLTQKEIEKTLRTGNVPIKLVLQDKIGSVISRATNTGQFIRLLKGQNISSRFNVSKTTGRVSGISFNYQGVVYKGSTLGKKFSWNNIVKHIDYEQIRDRTIILANNDSEQGNKGVVASDTDTSRNTIGKAKDVGRGAIQTSEKPNYDLGGTQKDGLIDEPFTPFKMELEDFDSLKRKKKRRKKRL